VTKRRRTSDPRRLGGDISGPGGPYDQGGVLLDTHNSVLLDHTTVAMLDNASDGRRIASLLLEGRVNRSTDRTRVLYMLDADGAAAIVSELVALAGREGGAYAEEFLRLLRERMDAMPRPPDHG
jgi:hypothetical protein